MKAGVVHPLPVNGGRYHGINVLILWSEAAAKGYANPVWMTVKEANALEMTDREIQIWIEPKGLAVVVPPG